MTYRLVLRAAEFAATKHRDQRRKDHEASPYINHPLSVALLIAEVGGEDDPETLAAALLHDTVEDTDTSPEELEAEFGGNVRRLVAQVTDDKNLDKDERKRRQIDHASELSREAALIKLADKISNVRDVEVSPPSHWTLERRTEYLDWAEAVIDHCPRSNEALERCFRTTLDGARRTLLAKR